jgi:hypothetical protein
VFTVGFDVVKSLLVKARLDILFVHERRFVAEIVDEVNVVIDGFYR